MTLRQLQAKRDRVASAELRRATLSREFTEAIHEARKTYSVQQIADALGVHRQRVYQLLNREG
jgi:transposase